MIRYLAPAHALKSVALTGKGPEGPAPATTIRPLAAFAHRLPRPSGRGLALIGLWLLSTPAAAQVSLSSPGFTATQVDASGRIVSDWGATQVVLSGERLPKSGTAAVEAVTLDGGVPAARSRSVYGPLELTVTAYRAPIFPAGVDVVTIRVRETAGAPRSFRLSLRLPEAAALGDRVVKLGGRAVLALPEKPEPSRRLREWGNCDESVAMPGWATPSVPCDPAFRNIRAGMGGVPIRYRFAAAPGSSSTVILGFCESFWSSAGQRPLVCAVEGAPQQEIDPLARWGRHKAGVLAFAARDVDGDGALDMAVLPRPGAPDSNPILNAIWLFPAGSTPDPQAVIEGKLDASALRYVDVGGANDQSLYAPGSVDYDLSLPAKGSVELTVLSASPAADVPLPDRTAWTAATLMRAAREVHAAWRDR